MPYKHAIVRPPNTNFAQGLTTTSLGEPNLKTALDQHAVYCAALARCGLTLTRLEPESQYPDSTFVEDTAIVTERSAILTRPGAISRREEVSSIEQVLNQFYPVLNAIHSPGTLDGGDICAVGDHFFIGISARTNEDGAQQLTRFLEQDGFSSSFVDIRGMESLLHLKSGIAYLGEDRLVLVATLEKHDAFQDYEIIKVDPDENYAANCVRVNDYVLMAAGYPKLEAAISSLGYQVLKLEVSEFQKMDGGLSCLSLRF